MTLATDFRSAVQERAPRRLVVGDRRVDPRRGDRSRHRDLQHRACRPDQAAAGRRARPRHAPVGARRCPFAAGRGGVAAGSARVAGRPEELHRDRAVRIGQLGGTARHRPGTAVPRRAERGVVGILRRARRTADDREDLPPRGRSSRRTADGGVERRRLAAAVFVRSLRRRTAADRRDGHEGRCLRSDRRHAAGLPHSRGRAGLDRARARARGRCRRAGMAG